MTLSQQVCSLELAKRLKELGVKQDGYFSWATTYHEPVASWITDRNSVNLPEVDYCSAFTVAELGEMLPRQVDRHHWTEHIRGKVSGWISFLRYVEYEKTWDLESFEADSEADARAKMLIYLLEKKLI
jgi:hypothetical protein